MNEFLESDFSLSLLDLDLGKDKIDISLSQLFVDKLGILRHLSKSLSFHAIGCTRVCMSVRIEYLLERLLKCCFVCTFHVLLIKN